MPLQATSGAASYDAYGGGVAVVPIYIEDVFSTYLYTGNGSGQTINNGIDLAGKGGLVWMKSRSAATDNILYDTARGVGAFLESNTTDAQAIAFGITAFNNNGFTFGNQAAINTNAATYVSWTFRKQPKFFDVVTYTGDGTSGRVLSHSLGSAPGCVIIKCTSAASHWFVYHTSLGFGTNMGLLLNSTVATGAGYDPPLSASSSTNITLSTTNPASVNGSSNTYVAYLFAHNAGGFGLTGTDNVISCGSYTGNGSTTGPIITLGYEPQWVMIKNVTTGGYSWNIMDNMRGMPVGGATSILAANDAGAEGALATVNPLATGFQLTNAYPFANQSGDTYIYIAIRRGPMKTPTSGTSVFTPVTANNTTGTVNTTGFPVDLQLVRLRALANDTVAVDRLRGISTTTTQGERGLLTDTSDAEFAGTTVTRAWDNTGFQTATGYSGYLDIYWNFRRAPGFFDEVCYTGTGSATPQAHNLGVAPELMIFKNRTSATNWAVYHKGLGATQAIYLNGTGTPVTSSAFFNDTAPTSSLINLGFSGTTNAGADNMVAYLFATCPGVSKVGSYTGNGTTQTINCGFTGGARFVLIKRTDSTGDWYVYDTARGMTTLTDPYLLLNSTAAETATLGSVTTVTTGFALNASILAAINTNGASYIFLAIA